MKIHTNRPIHPSQGHYEAAREKYTEALTTLGYHVDLAYNIALCHFKLKQFGPALKFIMEIIEVWMGTA